jgi:hypothetical protein
MTSPARLATRPVPDTVLPLPARETTAPVLRHRGCYWDQEQAGWVAFTALPLPRPAQE